MAWQKMFVDRRGGGVQRGWTEREVDRGGVYREGWTEMKGGQRERA